MNAGSSRILGALFVVALLFLIAGAVAYARIGQVRAQEASPEATPEMPDCTADLGIVRSTKVCVNVVHASPDALAVDVYLNEAKVNEHLAFGRATGFVELPGGTYQIQVVPAGGDVSAAVIDIPALDLVPAKAYEIAAVGLLADVTAQVYEVDVSALPERNRRWRTPGFGSSMPRPTLRPSTCR
jgi:hypothetical protein